MSDTISGFTPYHIHTRDDFLNVRLEVIAHECIHILDREGGVWPRRITHPVRSLYRIHKQTYHKSKFEVRAYAWEDEVARDEWDRVDIPDKLIEVFRTAPRSPERTHYWTLHRQGQLWLRKVA